MTWVKLDGNYDQAFMKQRYEHGYGRYGKYGSDHYISPTPGDIKDFFAKIPDDPADVKRLKAQCDVWLDASNYNGDPSVLEREFFLGNLVYWEDGRYLRWREPFYSHRDRCMKYIPDGPARLKARASEDWPGTTDIPIGKEAREHGFKASYAGDRAKLYRQALKRLNGELPLPDGKLQTCEKRIGDQAKPMCKWARKMIISEIARLEKIDRVYRRQRDKKILIGIGVATVLTALGLYLYFRWRGGGGGDGKSRGGFFRTIGRGAKRLFRMERRAISSSDVVEMPLQTDMLPAMTSGLLNHMPTNVPVPSLIISSTFVR